MGAIFAALARRQGPWDIYVGVCHVFRPDPKDESKMVTYHPNVNAFCDVWEEICDTVTPNGRMGSKEKFEKHRIGEHAYRFNLKSGTWVIKGAFIEDQFRVSTMSRQTRGLNPHPPKYDFDKCTRTLFEDQGCSCDGAGDKEGRCISAGTVCQYRRAPSALCVVL